MLNENSNNWGPTEGSNKCSSDVQKLNIELNEMRKTIQDLKTELSEVT